MPKSLEQEKQRHIREKKNKDLVNVLYMLMREFRL